MRPLPSLEGVDAFELMVDERHADERVGIEGRVGVHEGFEVGHEVGDLGAALGRGVDDLAGVTCESGAGDLAEAGVVFLEDRLNFQNLVAGEEACLLDALETSPEGFAVAEDFLGGGALMKLEP